MTDSGLFCRYKRFSAFRAWW